MTASTIDIIESDIDDSGSDIAEVATRVPSVIVHINGQTYSTTYEQKELGFSFDYYPDKNDRNIVSKLIVTPKQIFSFVTDSHAETNTTFVKFKLQPGTSFLNGSLIIEHLYFLACRSMGMYRLLEALGINRLRNRTQLSRSEKAEILPLMAANYRNSDRSRPIITGPTGCLSLADIYCLQPEVWFNDSLMDFCLKEVLLKLNAEQTSVVHLFSVFFYTQLRENGYSSVKGWLKKINIFEKELVFIPIHEDNHWLLIALVNFHKLNPDFNESEYQPVLPITQAITKPMIIALNSLSYNTNAPTTINRFVTSHFSDKFGENCERITKIQPQVPQQSNDYDCGIFVILFADELLSNPIQDYSLYKKNGDWSDWFYSRKSKNRRRALVHSLENRAKSEEKKLIRDVLPQFFKVKRKSKGSEHDEPSLKKKKEFDIFDFP
ncbi:hypothetical protein RCL1_002379 [Eukaryota sp. TZLM3-RCL]